MPHLEITELVLIYRNIVTMSTSKIARVLYSFVPNEWFGQLLDTWPKTFKFLRTFDSEFLYIEISFTDRNSKLLEIN